VQWEGWEYAVLHRELGAHRDPDRNMFVTVIEFESQAVMIGALGLTVSLISYPLVFVRKVSRAACLPACPPARLPLPACLCPPASARLPACLRGQPPPPPGLPAAPEPRPLCAPS
jgi:hypothetical protein